MNYVLRSSFMEQARQTAKRYLVPIRVRDKDGHIDNHYTDYILEITKNRLFIRTNKPLPAHSKISIEFNLKDYHRPVIIKGEVIKVSKGSEVGSRMLGAGMGIVLEAINPEDSNILKESLQGNSEVVETKEYAHFATWLRTLKAPMSDGEKEKIKRNWLMSVFEGEKAKETATTPEKQVQVQKKEIAIKPAREIEQLKKIQIFEELSDEQLSMLAEICHKEVFKAGEIIFDEGAVGDKFYMIHKGEIRISKIIQGIGEEALVVLKEGSYFGEMALIDDAPRSATAICNTNAALLVINKDNFENTLKENSDLASKLLWTFVRTLSIRLRETNEKIKSFFAMTGGNQW